MRKMAAPIVFSAATKFNKHFLELLLYRQSTRHVHGLRKQALTLGCGRHRQTCCSILRDSSTVTGTVMPWWSARVPVQWPCAMLCRTAQLTLTSNTLCVSSRHPPAISTARGISTATTGSGSMGLGIDSRASGRFLPGRLSSWQTVNTSKPLSYSLKLSTLVQSHLPPGSALHRHSVTVKPGPVTVAGSVGLGRTCGLRNLAGSGDLEAEAINNVQKQGEGDRITSEENAGWLIRLANENGYLSWCRNVYIATVVAVTMYAQDGVVPYAKEAAFTIILLGCLNLLSGTIVFMYNLLSLRRRMLMSRVTLVYNWLMAVVHVLLWGGAVALFMGFVEEVEDEDEEEKRNAEKKKKEKKNIVRSV